MKKVIGSIASYVRSIRFPDPQVHSNGASHQLNRELIRLSHLEI